MRRRLVCILPCLLLYGCQEPAETAIQVGVSTLEGESDRVIRWEPFRGYLERRLHSKVILKQASDYAGVIEALKAHHIDLAYFGAAAFARAYIVTGGQVIPLAATLNEEGQPGYYSVIAVRADSPYRSVRDLRGKTIAFADPNSTSGYLAPSWFLKQAGIEPDSFFGRVVFAGNHEAAVIAAHNRTADAAATWAYGPSRSNIRRMSEKGMIPDESMREIWRSPMIPTSAWTVRTDCPSELRQKLRDAILEFAQADPASFAVLSSGRETGYAATDNAFYEPVVKMVRAQAAERTPYK